MMSANELRQLSTEELEAKLLAVRKEQFALRLQRSNGTLEKTHPFSHLRKDIARIKTILTEKQSEVNRGE